MLAQCRVIVSKQLLLTQEFLAPGWLQTTARLLLWSRKQRQACSGCGPCADGESCWRDFRCQEYAWVHHTDPMDYCPDGRRRGDWCMYDLRDFGLGYFYAVSTGNVVAGADPAGARCGSWVDKYPCYVPVPCIEVQPVAPGSGE